MSKDICKSLRVASSALRTGGARMTLLVHGACLDRVTGQLVGADRWADECGGRSDSAMAAAQHLTASIRVSKAHEGGRMLDRLGDAPSSTYHTILARLTGTVELVAVPKGEVF